MMANPSGINQDEVHAPNSSFNGGVISAGNGNMIEYLSPVAAAMKYNPGISLNWTAEEQLLLEDGLGKYASDSSIVRFAKIAMQLQDKTIRDVALRCTWMTKKENSKRRKEDHNMTRKSKDKKERVNDTSTKMSNFAARASVSPHALPMIPIDVNDGISCTAIGGAAGKLIEQNVHAFNQISSNLTAYQYQENINLFCQARDNILSILNNLNDMHVIMRQMPPLTVKLNEELATNLLGHPSLSMK